MSIDETTLSVSGPALTDGDGTIISLGTSGLVVGSSTYAFPTPATDALLTVSNGPVADATGVFTIDHVTFVVALRPSFLSIVPRYATPNNATTSVGSDGAEISELGPPATVNGTVFALDPSALAVGAQHHPVGQCVGAGRGAPHWCFLTTDNDNSDGGAGLCAGAVANGRWKGSFVRGREGGSPWRRLEDVTCCGGDHVRCSLGIVLLIGVLPFLLSAVPKKTD